MEGNGHYSAPLGAGKSLIIALFAAFVLPGFRNPSRWLGLAMTGLIAATRAYFRLTLKGLYLGGAACCDHSLFIVR